MIELVGEELQFDEGFAFGMEMAPGIAAEVFDLIVEAFGQVGRTEMGAERGWELKEEQVMGGPWLEAIGPG